MTFMFLLELKHTPGYCKQKIVCNICQFLIGGECFYVYFIKLYHSEFCMVMSGANPFICCYNISDIVLPKCVPFNRSSGFSAMF